MRPHSIPVIVLIFVLFLLSGCISQVDQLNESQTTIPSPSTSPTASLAALPPLENVSNNRIETHPETCNFTRVEDVFRTTRTEKHFGGATPYHIRNISLAVNELGPGLKIPAFLPGGYRLQYIALPWLDDGIIEWTMGFTKRPADGSIISDSSANWFYIRYSPDLDVQFQDFVGGKPEFVCINGTPGFYYSGGILRWLDGNIERWIVGPLDKNTLIRIAESMKDPSELDLSLDVYSMNETWMPLIVSSGITVPGTPPGTKRFN